MCKFGGVGVSVSIEHLDGINLGLNAIILLIEANYPPVLSVALVLV